MLPEDDIQLLHIQKKLEEIRDIQRDNYNHVVYLILVVNVVWGSLMSLLIIILN